MTGLSESHLLKLMDAEDTPGIFSMSTGLLSVACTVPGISLSYLAMNTVPNAELLT
jgi:hypothetical protein